MWRIAVSVVAMAAAVVLGNRPPSNTSWAAEPATAPPKTAFWDGPHLAALRDGRLEADPRYQEVRKRLRKNAEIALKRGPYSVMDKNEVAPSGDKHDYLSYARYWWPNPKSDNGLPYIRHDGKTNRALLEKGDREIIGRLYDDVETLALAGYLFGDDRYSQHGAMLVRTWFLDPETRMNPHLRYAQAVPGKNDGRGSGIIDTRYFIRVLDGVALLNAAGAWSVEDQNALAAWMTDYLAWLQTDPMGKDEGSEKNNHGTWYDAQTAAIALFVGKQDLARQIIENAKTRRIGRCIEPDGLQPEEMRRTKGLHYCIFNLSAMAVLARIGEPLGVDLWHFETPRGSSLRRGLDFVLPYAVGEQPWPEQQIEELDISPSDMGLFYLAASRYDEPRYLRPLMEGQRRPMKFEYVRLEFAGE